MRIGPVVEFRASLYKRLSVPIIVRNFSFLLPDANLGTASSILSTLGLPASFGRPTVTLLLRVSFIVSLGTQLLRGRNILLSIRLHSRRFPRTYLMPVVLHATTASSTCLPSSLDAALPTMVCDSQSAGLRSIRVDWIPLAWTRRWLRRSQRRRIMGEAPD